MATSTKLAIISVLANLPLLMAIAFMLSCKPSQQEIFDRVSNYALAYDKAVDKEQ